MRAEVKPAFIKEDVAMKRCIFLCLFIVIFAFGQSYAGDVAQGTYIFNDGKMKMTLNMQELPDGKYFINGDGTNNQGKTCRVGDIGEIKGGRLILGACEMKITVSGNTFELKDTAPCITCEPGAYVSGTYYKQ